jgi:hypothetical protein
VVPPLDLGHVSPAYWRFLAVAVAFLVAAAWLAWRMPRPWRHVVAVMVVVLTVRLILLQNPLAWRFYASRLDPNVIGWRQYQAVVRERDNYFAEAARVRYVAVGSSQTGMIYGGYAESHPELELFGVVAMQPLDFLLYRDYIVRYRSERVLLYLSDFDIARRPPAEAIVLSPRQGLRLFDVWARLRRLPASSEYTVPLAEMLVGEVFPEFKYGFVFRDLADRCLRRVAEFPRRVDTRPPVITEDGIRRLRATISADYIAFNMDSLRDFLRFVTSRGIGVVIIEGEYNPLVSTEETRRVSGIVSRALDGVARQIPNVRYVRSAAIMELTKDDYSDLTHVKPEVGYEFTRRVVGLLDTLDTADAGPDVRPKAQGSSSPGGPAASRFSRSSGERQRTGR